MKKLVLISTRDKFTMTRLYKDEGLLPYYIGKEYKLKQSFYVLIIKKNCLMCLEQ